MTDISLESVTGKLNRAGYDAFIQALRHAKSAGNRNIELAHWLFHILQQDHTDLSLSADYYKLDRGKLLSDLAGVINGFRKNETDMPGVANPVIDILDRGWHYATLFFGETQIRTGHLLVAGLKSTDIRRALTNISQEFSKVNVDALAAEHRAIWAGSEEENLRPMDGSGAIGAGTPGADQAAGPKAPPARSLFPGPDRQSQDRRDGSDPRPRQRNPPADRRADAPAAEQSDPHRRGRRRQDCRGRRLCPAHRRRRRPPPLKSVRLCALDIGLMQAGASMKGEFEQRLRSVIDEVQSSPTPIILFIDEAHTLIGAGGAAGTGDAANLLKPALARGTLRTIAATTWAEYRQYIEKDPALTRRFQPIHIDEPSVETCCTMLRGILGPMEKHHGVRISDAAITAAVNLSHRYIPARQLPDKAVEPARYRRGPRRHQPERDAGHDRGHPCRDRRPRGREVGIGQRQRPGCRRRRADRRNRHRHRRAQGQARRPGDRLGHRAKPGRRNQEHPRHPGRAQGRR